MKALALVSHDIVRLCVARTSINKEVLQAPLQRLKRWSVLGVLWGGTETEREKKCEGKRERETERDRERQRES